MVFRGSTKSAHTYSYMAPELAVLFVVTKHFVYHCSFGIWSQNCKKDINKICTNPETVSNQRLKLLKQRYLDPKLNTNLKNFVQYFLEPR